jgi:hypothetical protein
LSTTLGDKVGDKMKQMSARAIAAIKAPGRYRVDENLSVWAQEKNGRVYCSYLLRYQVGGKRIERSLGSTTKITLKQARDKAQELMASMVAGEGVPAEQLQKEQQAKKASARRVVRAKKTFSDVADEFINQIKVPGWKNPLKSSQTWKNRLSTHAYSVIGNKPLADITKADMQ